MSLDPQRPNVDEVLERLRASLKARGASGIRGLGRHFRICDTDKSGALCRSEFNKCMRINKLDLSAADIGVLFDDFDRDGSGEINYDEFLQCVRGTLPPIRRALVLKVFDVLDRVNPDGVLTVEDIEKAYSTSKHPDVMSGKKSKREVLEELIEGFEGSQGNRDGKVTKDEWVKYYEEVSASIDSDDHFGVMIETTWRHLKTVGPDGKKVPAIQFVPAAQIDLLEREIRKSIYAKSTQANPQRVLEKTFGVLDKDGSGEVSIDEFVGAMERFGLHVQGLRPGLGGLSMKVVQALFDQYDSDGSGSLSHKEFCSKFFAPENKPPPPVKGYYAPPPGAKLPDDAEQYATPAWLGKPCYEGNMWLKGSNHVVGT